MPTCFGVRLTQLLLAWLFPTQASRRLWRAAARCSQVPRSFEFSQPRAVSPVRRWGTSSCQELHWKPDGYVISATATAGQLLYLYQSRGHSLQKQARLKTPSLRFLKGVGFFPRARKPTPQIYKENISAHKSTQQPPPPSPPRSRTQPPYIPTTHSQHPNTRPTPHAPDSNNTAAHTQDTYQPRPTSHRRRTLTQPIPTDQPP
jgi:hypothetical protein